MSVIVSREREKESKRKHSILGATNLSVFLDTVFVSLCVRLWIVARWNHIEDLDSFFTRMYNYHQRHGFAVMMLQEFFELVQFVFVVFFLVFLFYGVNYPVLFG